MKIYVCSQCGWFPSVGRRDRGFPLSFFIRALGSTVGRGGSESAPWRADHKAPRLPAGRETVRKACQRIAPGGAGASPRLPQPGFVSPLLTPPPFLLLTSGTPAHPRFPFSLPFSSAETPPSSGPCTLLPSASPVSRGKTRLGPARPRRRRVPGSVTPASL